jgi:hypothetical protein
MDTMINPLEILKKRKLNFLPPHFLKIKISEMDLLKDDLENWVKSKLKGRYCIIKKPTVDPIGKLKSTTFLGLEDPKEMTYFMLSYPLTRR